MAFSTVSALVVIVVWQRLLVGAAGSTLTLLNVLYNGSVNAETISGGSPFDSAKLSTVANSTSYDWWYFDVVSSSSSNESISVLFYNTGPNAFAGGDPNSPLSVQVSGSFPNGTTFNYAMPVTVQAVIEQSELGVSGDWQGTGLSFSGSNPQTAGGLFKIEFESPKLGLFGSINMKSANRKIANSHVQRAPGRYSCGPDVPGSNELTIPGVGWINAVPDADADVDLTVDGVPFLFAGIGYHDKNWGIEPLNKFISLTYWGHARVGPYSVVWGFNIIPGGQLYPSAAVAKDGRLLTVNCAPDGLFIRPWGANNEYPPTVTTGTPQGLEIVYDLGYQGILSLNVTTGLILVDSPYHQRFLGSVQGTLTKGCNQTFEGKAIFEQFRFIGL
ncbi:hypothetical protein GQ53DRAFT_865874 [Thozetella sp. PMI_491]|nr:hypothetical protein GQ53DRAFT_865874 [Thozetella sp. PMI_491]